MEKFRIGITPDVLQTDGASIFGAAPYALIDDPSIEWEYIPGDASLITPAHAARYDAICAMITRVTPASLGGPDLRLKLIARFGVGYDSIDVPACTAAGVMLSIAPDGVRRPVATAALTFVLALAQKLGIKDRLTREGRWAEKLDHTGTGLTGRVLGSIGIGNIGAELFRLAAPLEMVHLAHDPHADPALAESLGVRLVDLDTLCRESDFLCVNCPLDASTRGLVGERLLGLMKPSAYLVNTARGPIVDEAALVRALREGRIAGAGLDVFEQEPTPRDNPLLAMDNVIVTPHAICFTDECMRRLAESAFRAAAAVAAGRVPPFLVNPAVTAHPRLASLAGGAR
jgi:phosphoglycerate dehydrogenase-like enzyme